MGCMYTFAVIIKAFAFNVKTDPLDFTFNSPAHQLLLEYMRIDSYFEFYKVFASNIKAV